METNNKQQSPSFAKAVAGEEAIQTPNSKLSIQNSTLTKSPSFAKASAGRGLHSFTHFDIKPTNEGKIKEMNPKIKEGTLVEIDQLIIDDEAGNVHDDLWESNHALISKAIHELMRNLGRVPTKKEIAAKSGLSRPTIHKHLKGFAMHPLFVEEEEQFQMLSSNVMAKVYEFAMLGDSRAARLYFEITGKLK